MVKKTIKKGKKITDHTYSKLHNKEQQSKIKEEKDATSPTQPKEDK